MDPFVPQTRGGGLRSLGILGGQLGKLLRNHAGTPAPLVLWSVKK